MPFTGSHPAAVLPLLRTSLPASALVAGSLAPDALYYLPRASRLPTHTALGVLTVDTLIGATGWALWHGLLARPAVATAPAALRARLAGGARATRGTRPLGEGRPGLGRRLREPRSAARVVAGLAVGAASHVLWDEFTHAGRWGTAHVPALARTWRGRPGTVWAQDASGVAGAGVLLAWAGRWWRRTPARPVPRGDGPPAAWAAVAAAGLVAGSAAAVRRPDPRSAAEAAALRAGAAATVAALVLALGWHARHATDPARGFPDGVGSG